jgi:catalase
MSPARGRPSRSTTNTKPSPEAKSRTTSKPRVGNGGETHQVALDDGPVLTTQQGAPISDGQNALTVGRRGPVLLEDFALREKIFHFDHERIPERVVHARGYGAHGYFENYESLADLTCADLFQRAGEQTPAFVRFSTVAGSEGSADLARDVRGFAVKIYTKEGNWDLVGNNIPVFFIQDASKFPDLVHSVKPEPDRGFPQAQSAHDNFWDFASLMPESTHMLMWVMSDRGLPRSFRFMEGFGVHTFRMINQAGVSRFVKFHWKPKLGLQSVLWDEAVKINGADPDFHRRDLWNAIDQGSLPEWELGVQVFDEAFADEFEFDVLDATKLIPEEVVPLRRIGRLVLNRLVDNFFAETEQVAFCTQNIVRGIDFSNDPLLQGRNFSYLDTQLKRLGGPNFAQLPINAPKCPFAHFQQDGHMAMANPAGRVNYEPNSRVGGERGPREDPAHGFASYPAVEEGAKQRLRPESFADHYSQARQFYRSQTSDEQLHIVDAFVFELSKVEDLEIRRRMVANLLNVDEKFASSVALGLGLEALPDRSPVLVDVNDELPPSPALGLVANGPTSFAGRKIGVLITSGASAKAVNALRTEAEQEGAQLEFVTPTVGGVVLDDHSRIVGHQMLGGGPSVLYDAVAVIASRSAVHQLTTHPAARQFVTDAHTHCKFIGYTSPVDALFAASGIDWKPDAGYFDLGKRDGSRAFVRGCRRVRLWERATTPSLL